MLAFQVGHKYAGRFVLDKHVGSASADSPDLISALAQKAHSLLFEIKHRHQLPLFTFRPVPVKPALLKKWHITGFHRVFGSVYDRIGFPATLLRDLVIGRIVYPRSKLATLRYFDQYLGIHLAKDSVYRFLDTLSKNQLVTITSAFVGRKPTGFSCVLYDVTTLHFETEVEDDLRQKGYSKNHRHDLPQILIGLFVNPDGYPFDFDVFSGSTFEGHTLKTALQNFLIRHQTTQLTVVADAGMLSRDNLKLLESLGIHYIVGARIKNLAGPVAQDILAHDFTTSAVYTTSTAIGRLIVEYSSTRAAKDQRDREHRIQKIQQDIQNHKPLLRKRKYVAVSSPINVGVGLNEGQIAADRLFDGLKGYYTDIRNTDSPEYIISQYKNLWQVETAFRMSKSDLRERPIYHTKPDRIMSHLCICFVSLLVIKESERILKTLPCGLQQAISLLGRIGSGTATIGNLQVGIDSEIDSKTQSILNLFEGH